MAESIPFTSDHDRLLRNHDLLLREHGQLLRTCVVRLDSLEVKSDRLETRFDRLETRVDKLEMKVGNLVIRVEDGFRRADVMHEDLCSKFNTLVDLVLLTHQKLDALSGVPDQVNNHEVRIGLIESHLKKDA